MHKYLVAHERELCTHVTLLRKHQFVGSSVHDSVQRRAYHIVLTLEIELKHLTGTVVDNQQAFPDKLRIAEFIADKDIRGTVFVAHHPVTVVLSVMIVDR